MHMSSNYVISVLIILFSTTDSMSTVDSVTVTSKATAPTTSSTTKSTTSASSRTKAPFPPGLRDLTTTQNISAPMSTSNSSCDADCGSGYVSFRS